jgi:3-hydroxybutyryl-CoA dehydratase
VSKLENFTFDEIEIGQIGTFSKTLTEQDLILFAEVSGDVNPVHLDAEFASTTVFEERIAHGMYTGALISACLATVLPGPGTIYLGQSLRFKAPVKIGDTVSISLTVVKKRDDRKFVTLECEAKNQHDEVVAIGTAEVIAPSKKLSLVAPQLPKIMVG